MNATLEASLKRAGPYRDSLGKRRANYAPLSPLSFLPKAAAVHPDRIALVHGAWRSTWAETYDRCRRLASALARRGVGPGDTVAILAPNVPAMYEAHFGVPMTGAVLNTLNIRLDVEAIAFQLTHGESKVFIVDREFSAVAQRALSMLEHRLLVIDIDDPLHQEGTLIGAIDYESFLGEGAADFDWLDPDDEFDPIALNYTSGTTGNPKGVVTHHRGAYLNAVSQIISWSMPGKVIFRNELIEFIQYEPSTPEVYRRPLLIVPPWINKFYILDLNPEKSFIRWAVAQGLTVFVISWVNPDERLADKGFEAYMREGILAALDCVEQATGESEVAAIGYCVGGTLLAATLAYMAAVGDDRIESATFFTTQIDFTDAGDLKVFVDAEQLREVEEKMAEHGYLEGSSMAQAFNMLRPNDLIWSYYVNNYLKGKEPMPFDLLVWNSDSTRMPEANHKFYLRHCYLQNDLSNGRMELGGKRLDLTKVTIPVYELASREDHIAPARSVFTGSKCFGGPVRYVMAGSGHIAGVVNPPSKPKYQFWSEGPPKDDFESWVAMAKETPGSWWPDWAEWVRKQAPETVPAGGRAKAYSRPLATPRETMFG